MRFFAQESIYQLLLELHSAIKIETINSAKTITVLWVITSGLNYKTHASGKPMYVGFL